jgi:hypothetical protein
VHTFAFFRFHLASFHTQFRQQNVNARPLFAPACQGRGDFSFFFTSCGILEGSAKNSRCLNEAECMEFYVWGFCHRIFRSSMKGRVFKKNIFHLINLKLFLIVGQRPTPRKLCLSSVKVISYLLMYIIQSLKMCRTLMINVLRQEHLFHLLHLKSKYKQVSFIYSSLT